MLVSGVLSSWATIEMNSALCLLCSVSSSLLTRSCSSDSASARVRTTALVSGGQGATDSNASGTSAEQAWDDAIVVGDFDGDGVVEFAALQGGALTVFHGNGEVP